MSDAKPVVTRFAPSPTGYLHIGGARTALFSWAFARGRGGRFLLRIEDTDQKRSTPEATRRIVEDLTWLGIEWDEGPDPQATDPYAQQRGEHGPYFQSQRLEIYREHIERLITAGRAYRAYDTPEELAADRDRARQAGATYRYDREKALNLSKEQVARFEAEGRPHVVRFRMTDRDITVQDEIRGEVTIKAAELEDFVIQKSDGYPTFHLANVVDDALMGVTHVLRAQEHLMNTPRHWALQEALGFEHPTYAHLPLIFNPDGSKMSKRDKARTAREAALAWIDSHDPQDISDLAEPAGIDLEDFNAFMEKQIDDADLAEALARYLGAALPEIDVHDFRASGYLPEVVANYIALLGWSPGQDIERFDLSFLKERFSLDRVNKSNARFDRDKLHRFNADTIAQLAPEEFRRRLLDHFAEFHPEFLAKFDEPTFALFAENYRERSRTLSEPAQIGRFFILPDSAIEYDEKAVAKVLAKNNGEGWKVLRELARLLERVQPWSHPALEAVIKHYAEESGLGLGKVAQPLRVAASGSTVSPAIYDTLVLLGQQSTLARINRCLNVTQPQP